MKYQREELYPLVARLARKYAGAESSSVSYAVAEQLLGAVVYCMEEVDNGDIYSLYIDQDLQAQIIYNSKTGWNEIILNGYRKKTQDGLYQRLENNFEPCKIRMIPYCTFANRGESSMAVWNHIFYRN